MAGERPPATQESDELAPLLEYLKQHRGFDFAGYKRGSLERRIRKRMDAAGVDTYAAYEDYLEVNPDEFTELFNTILINVTAFFRDPPAWEFLANDVIPKLLDDIPADDPIRVWCAACASGEEAYTAAMVLAEALGDEDFRSRVKIYATDVDEDALTTARHATYSADALQAVPAPLREKYFEKSGRDYVFRPDLRRQIIFGRNDLVQDASISHVDLLISRNALMYLNAETQGHVLRRLNFSLNDRGFLFLGRSEMLVTQSHLFMPYDLRWRVFRKVAQPGIRERYAFVTQPGEGDPESNDRYALLRAGAADLSPIAEIVVDHHGIVVAVNRAARNLFQLGPADVGRPLHDLEVSYRPVDLRSGLEDAYETRAPVPLGRATWPHAGDATRTLEVEIAPINRNGTGTLGASITFADLTAQAELSRQVEELKRRLDTAHEELQSTVEELETTNEELQSTNEELETTNEELQSTNEELETMNEELRSTNDELQAVNEEHGERVAELDRLNLFLEGVLGNLHVAVVVLDRDQGVQLWIDSATEMWGLRSEEVLGQEFQALDIGLPTEQLEAAIHRALGPDAEETKLTVDAVNRRGRSFRCEARVHALVTPEDETYGVILLMSEAGLP